MAVRPASPRRRRVLRGLSTVLIVAGGLILVDAGLTLLWQEPLTALQTKLRQNGLRGDLRHLEAAGPTRLEARALAGLRDDRRRVAFLARSLQRRTADGAAVGRITIPRISADFVVVKGSAPADLRKGPGIYDQSALPGVPGTTAIAGHRTTYLAPFRHIDDLRKGDRITIEMPYATFTYRVEGTRIVDPAALWILKRVRYDRLVLSACHPLFSAAQRIVVFARLARVVPLRAARGGQPIEKAPATLTPQPS
jgi:sortase A